MSFSGIKRESVIYYLIYMYMTSVYDESWRAALALVVYGLKMLKSCILQHVSVNSLSFVKKCIGVPYLKISRLHFICNFSRKKVSIMFGQFVESVYLCIRNREGHPLR